MSFFDRLMGDYGSPKATYTIDLPEREGIARFRLIFFGRVQGVGFRYTARMIADQLGLTGWAHNNMDGTVAVEIQGKVATINMFVYQIQDSRYIVVDHIDFEEMAADRNESGFSIR